MVANPSVGPEPGDFQRKILSTLLSTSGPRSPHLETGLRCRPGWMVEALETKGLRGSWSDMPGPMKALNLGKGPSRRMARDLTTSKSPGLASLA